MHFILLALWESVTMSPLIVLAAVIATALAAPQAIKPFAVQPYQPLAYSAPAPFHAQYTQGYNHHLGYSAPAYKSYATFAPAPLPAVKPYAAFAPVHQDAVKPYATFQAAPVPAAKPYAAAPVVPAIQPYHAYHQYAGQQYVKPIAIVRFNHDDNFDGTFTYDFEGENGIASQASGYVKAISPEEQAQVMQGQYSYTAPDGTPIVTRWYADETGFHAEGAHLPENVAKTLPYKTA